MVTVFRCFGPCSRSRMGNNTPSWSRAAAASPPARSRRRGRGGLARGRVLGAHEPFLGGQQGRELVAGGEIRHVHHHAARPVHRIVRRRHERPALRIPAQLRRVTQEHRNGPSTNRHVTVTGRLCNRNQPGTRSLQPRHTLSRHAPHSGRNNTHKFGRELHSLNSGRGR